MKNLHNVLVFFPDYLINRQNNWLINYLFHLNLKIKEWVQTFPLLQCDELFYITSAVKMTLTHLSLQFPYSDDFPNLGNNTLFGSNLTVLIWFCCRTAAAALTRCRPAKCRAVQQRPLSGSPCCAARLRPVRLLCPWSCSTTRPRPAAPTTPSWWQRISSCWRLASPLRWGRGTRWSFCFLWITAGSALCSGQRAEAWGDACRVEVCGWSLQAAVHPSFMWKQSGVGGGRGHGPPAGP